MKNWYKKKVLGTFFGTIVEYYDYSLYGISVAVIMKHFFPNDNYIIGLSKVFSIYTVGYIAKPIGAILFGMIGDIYGRKIALSITMLGIIIPTFIIGILPEYSVIGKWSSIILILCRCFQGIFVAGEYNGAAIYVFEHFDKRFLYTASSIVRANAALGILLATVITYIFNLNIFPIWAWRIPFLISLPFGLIVVYYRQQFQETPDFKKNKTLYIINTKKIIKRNLFKILVLSCLAGAVGNTYQIVIVFMKPYLTIMLPEITDLMDLFSILSIIFFGISMPLAGIISDYYNGFGEVFKISFIGSLISCFLLFGGIKLKSISLILISYVLLSCFIAPFNALVHNMIIRFFATSIRYRSVSISYTLGSMIISGPTNYLCTIVMDNYKYYFFPLQYLLFSIIILYIIMRILGKKRVYLIDK